MESQRREQVAADKKIRDFTFESDDLSSWGIITLRVSMSGLRGFQGQSSNLCCGFSDVTTLNPTVKTFEIIVFIKSFMSLTLARKELLRGNLMIFISPDLISSLPIRIMAAIWD